MDLLFIHLTDIHIRNDDDLDILLTRTDSIVGAICNHIIEPDKTNMFLCITGDFVFSGQENQYTVVGMILEDIYCSITKRFSKVRIHPIFVPGNHDCNFNVNTAKLRDTMLASPTLDIKDAEQFKICTSIQKEFFDFTEEWKKKFGAMSCTDDRVLTVNEFNIDGNNIHLKFHCINTSWCSKKDEKKGKMKMVLSEIPDKNRDDIVITMMHHDAEWLDWEDKEVWDEYHRKYSDIILVGHDHAPEFIWKQNYDKSSNRFMKGNQLYDTYNQGQSGFNILKINTDTEPMQECFFSYEWNGNLYKKIIDTDYHPFIRNRFVGTGIELKEEVWRFLEDLDIDIFNKNRKELKLSDIFVFPTLKEEKKKSTIFFRDMQRFMSYIDDNPFVSIRGQKEYGKTALLKQIFKEFYLLKRFPVFLEPTQINSADGEALNRIITNRYEQTYENISADEIMQKKAEERICIMDNFEEMTLSDKSTKKFLKYLTNKFGKVILSKNHKLDLINPLSYVETNDFIETNFNSLNIQPARKTYRERIINNWLMLDGEEIDIDSPAFDAKRREKYTQIQTVMRGNLFNKTPVDLLLVLSYLDRDEQTQIDYSRYSFIYERLILEKLNAIGNKITSYIAVYQTLLQNIAYRMFQDGIQGYVKDTYITSIILNYKEHHSGIRTDVSDLLQQLVDYRFLERKNDNYRFKYSYMYFYFTGSFIAQKIHPDVRKEIIKDVFLNIDRELNYNVALFLAYNISIEFEILPVIKELGNILLAEFEDFKYEKIRELIEEWGGSIEKKVERIYTIPENEDIPMIRNKKIQKQEEKSCDEDISEDDNEKTTEDDVKRTNADVIKMGRLLDFTGNILKNYSGGMENYQREEAIDLMFKSVTKVLGSFCSLSMYTVDKLIEMVEEKIKDGDENTIAAKSDFIETIKFLIAEIWLQFVSANVSALAYGLECDDIQYNIDLYCSANSTDLVKMTKVEYLIRIASTKLPVSDIRDLYTGKNCLEDVSQNIFKNNIYRYLSSYQFDVKDRQAICSLLGFNIKSVFLDEQKLLAVTDK